MCVYMTSFLYHKNARKIPNIIFGETFRSSWQDDLSILWYQLFCNDMDDISTFGEESLYKKTVKPFISMDFTLLSFIYTRTRITWITRLLDLNFLFRPWSKLHWNFPRTIRILVLVTPLWRHPINSSCCLIGKNTKQFYNVIGATNRSRFIKMISMARFLMKWVNLRCTLHWLEKCWKINNHQLLKWRIEIQSILITRNCFSFLFRVRVTEVLLTGNPSLLKFDLFSCFYSLARTVMWWCRNVS